MSRKSRETILKRVREQKRREKAALKRDRRLARKMSKNAPEDGEYEEGEFEEGEYEEGEYEEGDTEPVEGAPRIVGAETLKKPIERVVVKRSVETSIEKP